MKSIFHLIAAFLSLAINALAAGNDWMTPLDGTLPLTRFSIPGTHDSGARFEPFPGTAKCQDLTLAQQLDAGVRFLDIRCRHQNDSFVIHHGQVYQNINFDDVLAAVTAFLDAHPGETVVMSVKEEYTATGNTRTFEQTFNSYVAKNSGKWNLGTSIPTLAAARGKIVLFRRFGATVAKGIDASNFPDDTTFSTAGRLRVQDHYNVTNNDTKWSYISALLGEARYGGPNTLYVNFASGTTAGAFGIPSITSVSNNINPRLTAFFNDNPSGCFGIVLMDFADAAKCELIYRTNAPAGQAIAYPAYFMIVNRNSGKAIDLIGGNAGNGAQVNQWTYDYNGPNQRWALAPTENSNHFRLTSWVSGKCACIEADSTVPGAKLHAFDYTGNNPAQQFDLIDAGNGYYKIRNVNSGLDLEIVNAGTANNDRIQQNTGSGSTNQQWRLQPWGDYFIRASTGKYVCVANSGSCNGNAVVQSSWEDNLWFKWRFESVTNGHLKVTSRNAPGRVICLPDASTAAGANTHLYDYDPANIGDQKLRIVPLTNGNFKFRFVHDNMSWDIPGGQSGNLIPLQQYPANTNAWQEFQLDRLYYPVTLQPLSIPQVTLDRQPGLSSISWISQPGYIYQPMWAESLESWRKLVPAALPGNGGIMGVSDPDSAPQKFYRLEISVAP